MKRLLILFNTWIIVVLVLFNLWTAYAQDGNKPVKTNPAPELPDKNRAELLQIQLKIMRMQAKYGALQQQIQQLQDEFQKIQPEYTAAQAAACKAAKVDCDKEYTLNLDTMNFEKKAVPPAPPAPEKKP